MMYSTMKTPGSMDNTMTAVVADANGDIFDLEGYAAVGMSGNYLEVLTASETLPMPHGSELMFLPDRIPIVFNLMTDQFETLAENPYQPGEPLFPVAVFNSPAYVNTATCAYEEEDFADYLPLFSYGAVGWHQDGFCSAVIKVDEEPRQDLRLMKMEDVHAGIQRMRKSLPDNRLRAHLEKCALEYGCPAAKNFFIGRCEAPLPTSRTCNARCIGCISLQKDLPIKSPQNRISFTPSPEEISGVALAHLNQVKQGIVSFGQGCEGDPLMAAHVIGPAIAQIRSKTGNGTINMNTNGSLPDVLSGLFDQGLDSIRISMNSARKDLYTAYYRPVNYRFEDVEAGIDTALRKQKRVTINYLNCPGVTDSPEETDAFHDFLKRHPVDLIQWRNLNFDPFRYWTTMSQAVSLGEPLGMKNLLTGIRERFPKIRFGYFNPPKERFEQAFDVHGK